MRRHPRPYIPARLHREARSHQRSRELDNSRGRSVPTEALRRKPSLALRQTENLPVWIRARLRYSRLHAAPAPNSNTPIDDHRPGYSSVLTGAMQTVILISFVSVSAGRDGLPNF